MARSALYFYITDEGQLTTLRGAPLSLDLKSIDAAETSRPQSARQHQKERSAHSERLLRMLSAQRTMALQATIEQQPGLALVVLASRLATSLFYQGYSQSAVKVSASDGSFAARAADSGITESAAWNHMESASAKWSARLPGEASEAFAWFASQEQSVVIDFIAYCTAKSVDAVSASEQDSVGSDLARDVTLDMKKWWTASAEGYFLHVTKAHIVDVVTEQISAEDGARVAAMKKGEAATVAEALLAPKKWLPAPWLLPSSYQWIQPSTVKRRATEATSSVKRWLPGQSCPGSPIEAGRHA